MPAQPNRRDFIHALMGFAAGVPLLQDTLGIKASKLSDKLAVVSMAGGNVVILEGGDGLLLVNGTLTEQSAGLMSFLADQFKNQHVSILFNTDWHFEHTGSNEAFRKAGAKIIAHENTKLWIGADFYSDWEKRSEERRVGK